MAVQVVVDNAICSENIIYNAAKYFKTQNTTVSVPRKMPRIPTYKTIAGWSCSRRKTLLKLPF